MLPLGFKLDTMISSEGRLLGLRTSQNAWSNKNSYDFALKDGIFSYSRCQMHIVT